MEGPWVGKGTLAAIRLRGVRSQALALVLALTSCADEPPPADAPPAGAPAEQHTGALAITIDDVPWVGATHPAETQLDATRRLLAALQAHGVTAVGFVNCDRVGADSPILRAWLDAGQELGNHTGGHLDLNRAPLEGWLRHARSCHAFLARLVDPPIWFRYPYLHQGPTRERRQAALDLLAELGSPIAHVSIDNSDWILAAAYRDAALVRDEARMTEIGDAFIDHILAAAVHYRDVARERVGRDIAHVLLLHANTLVADHLDRLLARLRGEGFRFVTLEQAQQDPVYALPDGYIGEEGLSWLYRIEPAAPELKAWDDAEAARLRLCC